MAFATDSMSRADYWQMLIVLIVLTVLDTVLVAIVFFYYTYASILRLLLLLLNKTFSSTALSGKRMRTTSTKQAGLSMHSSPPVNATCLHGRPQCTHLLSS